MTTMNAELYDALISANVSDDKARKAAVSVTSVVGYPSTDEIATKADLQEIKANMATKAGIAELEARLTWRMLSCAGLTIAAIGVLLAIFK